MKQHFCSFSQLLKEHETIVHLDYSGLNIKDWHFFFINFLLTDVVSLRQNLLFVFSNEDQAESFLAKIPEQEGIEKSYYPSFEFSPYSNFIESSSNLKKRIEVLSGLYKTGAPQSRCRLIATTQEALAIHTAPKNFFNGQLSLKKGEQLPPHTLRELLVEIGYHYNYSVEEQGQFTNKGEIFDIYPYGHSPIRIFYFDDLIEEIFLIDPTTNRTNKTSTVSQIDLFPGPDSLLTIESLETLRSHLRTIPLTGKAKSETRKELLSTLTTQKSFDRFALFFPLFYSQPATLLDHLDPYQWTILNLSGEELYATTKRTFQQFTTQYQAIQEDENDARYLPPPQLIYSTDIQSKSSHYRELFTYSQLQAKPGLLQQDASVKTVSLTDHLLNYYAHEKPKLDLATLLQHLSQNFSLYQQVIVTHQNSDIRDEILFLLNQETYYLSEEQRNKIQFLSYDLESGFYFPKANLLVISDNDLFGKKTEKSRKVKLTNTDLFADQISTLSPGNLVIHKQHGVGEYIGIETIAAGEQKNDFMVIRYKDNDKVYVPIYKFNLVQKYSTESDQAKVADLKTSRFQKAKEKAQNAVKKLAFDLLQLNAQRKISQGHSFSSPDHYYREFELFFPFKETFDQRKSIDDILSDMTLTTPMDRLVCGDVGFGKTEIAMRAAFKAVQDRKQVAVLVPTTILALQHYHTFKKRFQDFPVQIQFISRIKGDVEVASIIKDLEENRIDIIIGTHKLLNSKLKFSDLGLLIIDEEHRFGVNHKEKIKVLKSNIDCLTLSATPIPRTLQLAFLGLKDLSVIQTPPPNRQAIKSYVLRYDAQVIREAIEFELNRNGQVFYVHNNVAELEELYFTLKKLVPSARIVAAHGQLPPKEIEQKMLDFYNRKFDILLATTIIESGIDVPTANTMIIHNAQNFGLSQLHQLRGRIGRSDQKAYAYFIIPESKMLSSIADQRLKAIQDFSDLGAGFSIASCDLEIRGAGDILGAEQSGHIEGIGLELYLELLEDAMNEMKNQKSTRLQDIEIQSFFVAKIPDSFIKESSIRLKYYKRLSNARDEVQLAEIFHELEDIYGKIPEEMENFRVILILRIKLQNCGIKSVQINVSTIKITFMDQFFETHSSAHSRLLEFLLQSPRLYRLLPPNGLSIHPKNSLTQKDALNHLKLIAEHINPC